MNRTALAALALTASLSTALLVAGCRPDGPGPLPEPPGPVPSTTEHARDTPFPTLPTHRPSDLAEDEEAEDDDWPIPEQQPTFTPSETESATPPTGEGSTGAEPSP